MARRKQRIGRGVTGTRLSEEVVYRRKLLALAAQTQELIEQHLIPVIRQGEAEFRGDAIGATIAQTIEQLRNRFQGITELANTIAGTFTGEVDRVQKLRFNRMASRAIGVDQSQLLSAPGIANRVELAAAENARLIKSIPQQYLDKVEQLVYQNVSEGRSAGSIISEIRKVATVTKKRAKLIAGDQTAKLVSGLNQARQEALGVVGYRWRNAKDIRVRGNPAGLYPNSQFNHWNREGKFYLWKPMSNPPKAPDGKPFRQPPPDGPPGQPIRCRCTAEPVFQFE